MITLNKKALKHRLNMMYQLHGQSTLIAEAVKYNEKNTYQVAFEHCKGCEAEMPSIDHECIACGQETK